MEVTYWDRIWRALSSTYYTVPIVVICALLCTIIGIKFYRNGKLILLFIIYSLCCFLLFTGSFLISVFYKYGISPPSVSKAIILQTGNILFSLIELSIFYYYYLKIIKSNLTHTLMKIFALTFYLVAIYSLIKIHDANFGASDINQCSALISTIQFLLLLLPVFVYFLELFIYEPLKEMTNSPSIWIHLGFFTYVLVTLPFLIISESLEKRLYNLMYSLHFLSLNVLLLTVIKAFLCRKPITA